MTNLSIQELLSGGPARLRYVWRYSTSRIQTPESVAEHSYYVALYALLVAKWCTYNDRTEREIHISTLLQAAIVHDLEEARSGDFPRLFKHSSPKLKSMLDEVSKIAFENMISTITEDPLSSQLILCWTRAKDDTYEGRILEFCDFLSVLGFMSQETEGGNCTVRNHVSDMRAYFGMFGEPRFDFIRPLVEQSEVMMRKVFSNEY